MDDKQKAQLRKATLAVRHLLEGSHEERTGAWIPGDVEIVLRGYGIFRDRDWMPIERLPHLSSDQRVLRARLEEAIRALQEKGETLGDAVTRFIRESAYTWWNRLVALRAMEARGIIDETVRVRDSYAGKSLLHFRFRDQHPDRCQGEDEGLLALFQEVFSEVAQDLLLVFDPKSPLTMISPSPQCFRTLILTLSGEKTPASSDPLEDKGFEAPDLLGWVYQFWNEEEKNRVFEQASRYRKKIAGQDIIPATCIYTEPYMVRFLVENSLGRLWAAMHPDSSLIEKWAFFVRRQSERGPEEKRPVKEITFLDPACGSGHFLLVAFELLYQMYEQEGRLQTPGEICESIFENNLFGIDIDLRSVQLAAVSLYIKAKEKAPEFRPRRMNLVAADVNLAADGQLERFFGRHPEDRALIGPIKTIFKALEGVTEIGSLLELESPFEEMLREVRKQELTRVALTAKQKQLLLFPPSNKQVQLELPMGVDSWDDWKVRTIDRLRRHFEKEADVQDFSQALFGAQAEKGVGLIAILTRRYDVVATNPPYMGSKNMGKPLKDYVSRHYPDGKRDLFAAFILRCLSLSRPGGYVAMVTQQSWMFLRSFADMRKRILEEETVETIAHLGPRGFSEVTGEVVSSVLFALRHKQAPESHRLWAARLIGPKAARKKAELLEQSIKGDAPKVVTKPKQKDLLDLPETPLVYWLRPRFFELLRGRKVTSIASVCQGLVTGDDIRTIRLVWETPIPAEGWVPHTKGGGYARWAGNDRFSLDWRDQGKRIELGKNPRFQNVNWYFKEGLWYSRVARNSLGVRSLPSCAVIGVNGPGVFPRDASILSTGEMQAILNCRLSTYMARSIAQSIVFQVEHVARLPLPAKDSLSKLEPFQEICTSLKERLIAHDLTERTFNTTFYRMTQKGFFDELQIGHQAIAAILCTVEGILEREVFDCYEIQEDDLAAVIEETGIPTGWHPLVGGFEKAPSLPMDSSMPILMIENKIITHPVQKVSPAELGKLKDRLRTIYEKGRGAKAEDFDEAQDPYADGTDIVGGYIPIPPETFLEELAQKLKIHPISVYWLLQDIKKDGARCLTEERNHVRDWMTVLVLKLLGHRWPREVEAGVAVESYADKDGIIPLVEGTGEKTLLDRVRERLAAEMGEREAHNFEQYFQDLMGASIGKWLVDRFFAEHATQFRKRSIAWVLQSGRVGKNGSRDRRKKRGNRGIDAGAFSCMVYYHALDRDLLAKVRTRYLRPILQRREFEHEEARRKASAGDVAARAEMERLGNLLEELADFDKALQRIETKGFWCPDLEEIAKEEPLDQFTSRREGMSPPSDKAMFLRQEQFYDPDINDGVRVNIAPLQLEGVLAVDVLSPKDVDSALADRARWRADERRWCREGKLPKPGWWET